MVMVIGNWTPIVDRQRYSDRMPAMFQKPQCANKLAHQSTGLT